MSVVGLISPGQMGASLGEVLCGGGERVVTTLAGRGDDSRRRVAEAGLEVLADLDAVVASADVILSVVPPAAAVETAREIAAAAVRVGRSPLVADLNAVSVATLRQVASILHEVGLVVVDGSISGHPPTVSPGARLFLAGDALSGVAELGWTAVEVRPLEGAELGAASALKMCTASVFKGIQALEASALLTARHNGVLAEVVAELTSGIPQIITGDVCRSVAVGVSKSARFGPEMREIAATQLEAGLNEGLFEAVAELFDRLAGTPLAQTPADRLIVPSTPDELLDVMGI